MRSVVSSREALSLPGHSRLRPERGMFTKSDIHDARSLETNLGRALSPKRTSVGLYPLSGHESIETTQMYLHADLSMKERALSRTAPLRSRPGRFRSDDALLSFLNGL
jgi:hypothetical protein